MLIHYSQRHEVGVEGAERCRYQGGTGKLVKEGPAHTHRPSTYLEVRVDGRDLGGAAGGPL